MFRKIVISLLLLLSISACQKEWEPNLITDINDLQGRRVGVNLSWESDYILTGRKDMELFRYDSTADMIPALGYDKIDAICMDEMMWKLMENYSSGLIRIEPDVKKTSYIWVFNDEKLRDEFNEFLKEFKKTDDYAAFVKREKEYDGDYVDPGLPLTGNGRKLRVAFDVGGYPRSFFNPGDSDPKGFDFEPLIYFANAKNYQLEPVGTVYDDAMLGIRTGNYDLSGGYTSTEYAPEIEALGLYVSDPMDEIPIFFVQKTSREMSVDLAALEE